jgi:outer membrane murein-binding lipoprotein Lpp
LDVNGAIIEESKEIKELNKKIAQLDLKVNQVRDPSGKENLVSKD